MRKLILTICICSLAISGYSQVWKNVNIDSGICVSLPEKYQKKDTVQDFSITARTAYGNILITKIADNPFVTPDIYKKRHLDRYYTAYLKSVVSSSKGSILSEKDTLVGNLRVKDFILQIRTIGDTKLRKFWILHENSATYTFQFLYEDAGKEFAQEDINKFFNSISMIRDFDLESQFTKMRAGQQRTFFTTKNITIAAGTILLIVLLIILIRKRARDQQSD